jgi:DNA-binding NtrC family response regulator
VLVVGESLAETHALPTTGAVVVGRGPRSGIVIPDASVSREHAILRIEGGEVTIEELGSRNGTQLGGVPLVPGKLARVLPGASLVVGSIVLLLRVAEDEAELVRTTTRNTIGLSVSTPMTQLYDSLEQFAPSGLNVLILGETGVGKGVAARALHARSPRANRPFVTLSCAAIPDALLEAELFGYEEGAYTGAVRAKPGLLESAQGGTVFLDEVAELPNAPQAKLLRAVEDREISRLGSLKPIPLDVRFVSATNRDIEAEVAAGRFRKDLYFRLNGVTLHVPPLRERTGEIESLARGFADGLATTLGRAAPTLAPGALEALIRHEWPGNVRELKNAVERAVILSRGGPITRDLLGPGIAGTPGRTVSRPRARDATPKEPVAPRLRDGVDALERERILAALESCGGNQSRAAKLLGISRTTLIARLDRYGVPRPHGKRRQT